MKRHQSHVLAIASIALGMVVAVPAQAASVTKVDRGTWGASGVPSYVNMYIYVPNTLATKPPVVFAHHSCATPVSGYISSINLVQAAADKNGFILVLPEATGQNCWDVGSTKSLTHDGGGDTQAIAQMAKYVLTKYSADPARVYAMGGSSGAMMTQALIAIYPDIFKAGSARAGVPAGCWADGYTSSNQWSDKCAGGNTTKTAQQWGDLVRAMYPGYTGPRRRLQLFQGTADATISYKNMAESIKEWTNVLGLGATPSATDTFKTSVSTYNRQFWHNGCGFTIFEAWSGQNGGHSMAYEQDAILAFFGLDKAGGSDPETTCSGDGGVVDGGGTGGAGGTAGAGGAGGHGIAGTGGAPARGGSSGSGTVGTGGVGGTAGAVATGGSSVAGTNGTAGSSGPAGAGGGGPAGAGGSVADAGSGSPGLAGAGGPAGAPGRGGSTPQTGSAGSVGSAGSTGSAGSAGSTGGGDDDSGSAGCRIAGSDAGHPAPTLASLLLVALGLVVRRRRRG